MKTSIAYFLLILLSNQAFADGFNQRDHPAPGQQAKINRVIAQAWSIQKPPVDNIAVYQNVSPSNVPVNTPANGNTQVYGGHGVNLGLSVGAVTPGVNGQVPLENNVVTRDNIVICLHCQGN